VHFALAGMIAASRRPIAWRSDHPDAVAACGADILPTYNYWERMNRLYALKIYHWTFSGAAFRCPKP